MVTTSCYGIGATLCPICRAEFPWIAAVRYLTYAEGWESSGSTEADILLAQHMLGHRRPG